MLRFTIRDLLWLTVVVALVAGWWLREGWLSDEAARWKARTVALADQLEAFCVVTKSSDDHMEIEHYTNGVHTRRRMP